MTLLVPLPTHVIMNLSPHEPAGPYMVLNFLSQRPHRSRNIAEPILLLGKPGHKGISFYFFQWQPQNTMDSVATEKQNLCLSKPSFKCTLLQWVLVPPNTNIFCWLLFWVVARTVVEASKLSQGTNMCAHLVCPSCIVTAYRFLVITHPFQTIFLLSWLI